MITNDQWTSSRQVPRRHTVSFKDPNISHFHWALAHHDSQNDITLVNFNDRFNEFHDATKSAAQNNLRIRYRWMRKPEKIHKVLLRIWILYHEYHHPPTYENCSRYIRDRNVIKSNIIEAKRQHVQVRLDAKRGLDAARGWSLAMIQLWPRLHGLLVQAVSGSGKASPSAGGVRSQASLPRWTQ